jgi:hypothetical protein
MSLAFVTALDQMVPLDLTIEQEGVGGVTGKAPTVAIRDSLTADTYLDFGDNTFKAAGWGTKYAAMTEVERGHYTRTLDMSLITSLILGNILIAEFHVDDGGSVIGDGHDVLILGTDTMTGYKGMADTSLFRKAITNKQEEFSGTPGRIILFDDDDTTKILEQELRDEAGGGIIGAVKVPAKRTANILP